MYKLLIVDDERMITDLLYEFLQQKLEDTLEIYKTYSGRSAAAFMEQTPADILLTDINMPGMSGLQLHRAALEANPRCKVIFLSGYNDFSSIQYALRNESVDFILKTECNDVIHSAILKTVQTLDDERLQLRAREQLSFALPVMRERLILSLLGGEVIDAAALLQAELPLDADAPALLLLGRFDDVLPGMELYRLKHLADDFLQQDCRVFSVLEGSDLVWLIQPRARDARATLVRVHSSMDDIQKICERTSGVSLSMALAEDFAPFANMAATLRGLRQSMRNLSGLSRGMLLVTGFARMPQPGARTDWPYVRRILDNIVASIDGLRKDSFRQQYGELTQWIRHTPDLSRAETLEIVMRLCLAFLSNANNDAPENAAALVERMPGNGDSWPAYEEHIGAIAEAYFARQEQSSFRNTNELLGCLANYIHANLSGDTSLNTLAAVTHFNPSYLSRLFKQVAGVNLSEYIARLKFEKASRLLTESDMKIAEVARELGFETQSYFTRFFKKYAVVGPQEYRECEKSKRDKTAIKDKSRI